jgi:ATP-binding cassette subfamily A (ABC1) protein 3
MKILAGLIQSNQGIIYIDGKNVLKDANKIRPLLGICSRQNIIFENLTVREHLKFFCKLKGMKNKVEIDNEIKCCSSIVGLSSFLSKKPSKLSNGMKRRISVVAALCGNSKILIMDEPTLGLDPEAKKEFWNMLTKLKKNKTIFVSTNNIEEAEALGDRIAVLSKGNCDAVGSAIELKRQYEKGYRLICEKKDDFVTSNFLELLRNHVKNACLVCENKTEAIFRLDEEYMHNFRNIFKLLEDKSKKLGINSFGCSMPSLDEVILRVDTKQRFSPCNPIQLQIPIDQTPKRESFKKYFFQIFAILLKKFLVFHRNWKLVLAMAILSIYLLFALSLHSDLDPPKLKLTLDAYFETVTTFSNKGAPLTSRNYTTLFSGKDAIFRTSNPDPLSINNGFSAKGIKSKFGQFMKKQPIGTFITGKKTWLYFNREFLHSPALADNMRDRASLKTILQDTKYEITTYNHPFKPVAYSNDSLLNELNDRANLISTGLLFFNLFLLLTFWPLVLTINYVYERETGFKLMQFVSGMGPYIYWITSLIFDMIILTIIFCLLIGYVIITGGTFINEMLEFVVTGKHLFYSLEDFKNFLIISLSYGFSMLTFSYFWSFMFRKTSKFFIAYLLISILCE